MTNPILEKIKKEFPNMFIESFKQAPNLRSFGWAQYTPHFNDSETCTFDVYIDYPFINGVNADYDEESDISIKIHKYKTLETEEDVRINNEVAEKVNYSWFKDRQIGANGLCYNPLYDEAAANVVNQIKEVLRTTPKDFLLDMFGDHCKVTLFANGTIEVEEYEHD